MTPKQRRLKRLVETGAAEKRLKELEKMDFVSAAKEVLIKLKEERFEDISLTEVNFLLNKIQ